MMFWEFWGTVLLWIVIIVLLYVIIYVAVKEAINRSVVGQFLKTKYSVGIKEETPVVSDEEIEKELEELNK